MSQGKRRIVLIVIVIVIIGLLLKFVSLISPGSYSNAERYTLNINTDSAIQIIKDFKHENPKFEIPAQVKLLDEKDQYWFFIYFYYADKNQIVCTWLRPDGKKKTIFAFIGINQGLELGHWKDVNKDFSFFENRTIKKEFEDRILNKVKLKMGFQ